LRRVIPFAVVVAAAAPLRNPCPAAEARPNVILILADDLRFDALGFMGKTFLNTPNIDRLARRGTIFTNAFCTTAICPISRASILTGQYERRHKIADFTTPLTSRQFAATFPAQLREHGYRTGFIGKWGLGDPLPRDRYDDFRGFSGQGRYFPPGKDAVGGEHLTAKQAVDAIKFLDSCSSGQPFSLQISTKAPHVQDDKKTRPFPPDPKYQREFEGITISKPKTATDDDYRALPDFLRNSEARVRWETRFSTPERYQNNVKDYYRLIRGIDDLVGAVMAKLEQKHLDSNTVVIFTSDHGFYLGDRGLAGKWFMHEESIRVPMVICDLRRPPASEPRERSELVLNIDLAPTILDLAGIARPSVMQGASLVPLLEGKNVPWRDRFFYEHRFKHPRIPMSEGVRTKRWKYVRYTSVNPIREQLFDLQTDPDEQHDRTGDPAFADQLAAMRSEWERLSLEAE
jgi:arylsulfatase A-like enzyme